MKNRLNKKHKGLSLHPSFSTESHFQNHWLLISATWLLISATWFRLPQRISHLRQGFLPFMRLQTSFCSTHLMAKVLIVEESNNPSQGKKADVHYSDGSVRAISISRSKVSFHSAGRAQLCS